MLCNTEILTKPQLAFQKFMFCWPCILSQSLQKNNLKHSSFPYVCLFQFSACFEQPSAHHQESQLYQYDLWYMSLYVGDRVVCRCRRNSASFIILFILTQFCLMCLYWFACFACLALQNFMFGWSCISLQSVTICTCIPHGHLHSVTYTRGRIDTVDSPDDEHLVARNM